MQTAQLAYSDIDSDWKALESAAAEMLASCGTEDQQMIASRLAPLRTELAAVKETLGHKVAACELVTEHSDARTMVEERIVNIQERLKDDSLTVHEMEELRSDFDQSRSQLMKLESRHTEMETVMNEAGIVIKDREVESVVDIRPDAEKMLTCVEKEDKKLEVCAEIVAINARLEATDSELKKLKEVYADDGESLASSLQVLNYVFIHSYYSEP